MDPKDIPIRDLHLPPEIGWWPLAPGWWVLLALVVLAVGLLLWISYKRFVANNARRYATRELDRLVAEFEQHQDMQRLGSGLSALLRRAVLAYAPRSEVAGLTGKDWAQCLNRGLSQPVFTEGAGRLLLELPYRNPATVGEVDSSALIEAVRQRIRTPMGVAD